MTVVDPLRELALLVLRSGEAYCCPDDGDAGETLRYLARAAKAALAAADTETADTETEES